MQGDCEDDKEGRVKIEGSDLCMALYGSFSGLGWQDAMKILYFPTAKSLNCQCLNLVEETLKI